MSESHYHGQVLYKGLLRKSPPISKFKSFKSWKLRFIAVTPYNQDTNGELKQICKKEPKIVVECAYVIAYWENQTDYSKGVTPIRIISITGDCHVHRYPVYESKQKNVVTLNTDNRIYYFSAGDTDEMNRFYNSVNDIIQKEQSTERGNYQEVDSNANYEIYEEVNKYDEVPYRKRNSSASLCSQHSVYSSNDSGMYSSCPSIGRRTSSVNLATIMRGSKLDSRVQAIQAADEIYDEPALIKSKSDTTQMKTYAKEHNLTERRANTICTPHAWKNMLQTINETDRKEYEHAHENKNHTEEDIYDDVVDDSHYYSYRFESPESKVLSLFDIAIPLPSESTASTTPNGLEIKYRSFQILLKSK